MGDAAADMKVVDGLVDPSGKYEVEDAEGEVGRLGLNIGAGILEWLARRVLGGVRKLICSGLFVGGDRAACNEGGP